MTDAPAPAAAPTEPPPGGAPRAGPVRRVLRAFARIPHPPLRSKRGLFVAFVFVAGIGSAVTVGGVVAIRWTETADFCGRCHTMGPELKAYAGGPHRDVACAECHVEPGVAGFVKAKLNGTKQLIEIMTGSYPRPIPPPAHANLPPVQETCLRCHPIDEIAEDGGPVKIILRPRFREDEPSTRDTVAIILRPAGLGEASGIRGVHWHIESQVDLLSSDDRLQSVDWVGVRLADGTEKEYIARSAVGLSTDVGPDVDRLKATETLRRMDCIDCHNRIGHQIESPARAVDDAIESGLIDRSLPYVKREGVARVTADYPSLDAADNAIAGLRVFYQQKYPLVLRLQEPAIAAAIGELQRIYRDVATPEMRVSSATYPDNLGHLSAPGCFRCHDGAHYRIVGGKLTDETIPSACATCHTFPQVGQTVSGIYLGGQPDNHRDKLWVFSHKAKVARLDPAGTDCGACHTRTYCENCHKTGAVTVNHDEMLFNHAQAIRKSGVSPCAYCHQPVYCSKCHSEPVLPSQ